ncbi:ribose 5-phosphate isomerase B [Gudongella sp. SC589]|jgi:ribose 5-phosphate isomerase B|uniref:ribose 5-phosphate isomerase B n=1 Tax=Gudongella sp. SC589 TaxID=3385990 RepID=UPI00390466A5
MIIGIGSDHGGFELKEEMKKFLEESGHQVKDFGTHSKESVDYPDYGRVVGEAVVSGEIDRGVVICGTGIGISISANKVKGVRAALCGDVYSARMSREHNNANVIAMGGRVLGVDLAKEILGTFLKSEFQGGRHERRVNKIAEIEE